MKVLAFSAFFHDSAAALVVDDHIVAAAEEERFVREVHTRRFPSQAIDYCLRRAGIDPHELDLVTFFLDVRPVPLYASAQAFGNTLRWLRAHTSTVRHAIALTRGSPSRLLRLTSAFGGAARAVTRWPAIAQRHLHLRPGDRVRFAGIPHHLAHIAGSYLISGFDHAAILIADGRGEWDTTTMAVGARHRIDILQKISLPHSLGFLYGAVTGFLGFRTNCDEGKVMGLSAYGRPRYDWAFDRFLQIRPGGQFRLDTQYIDFPLAWRARYFPRAMVNALGPPRAAGAELNDRHADIASSLQHKLEEALIQCSRYLERHSRCARLCLSGGVAMNSAAAGRIARELSWGEAYVPPAPGDAGTAIGAAVWPVVQQYPHLRFGRADPYLGPDYGEAEYRRALDEAGLPYLRCSRIAEVAAKLLRDGYVLGWFQGRMEFGPRALGNRSILADPREATIRDRVNTLKGRELWRPLAPSVLDHRAREWFVEGGESPYMSFVKTVRAEKVRLIPACVHVDGSARVHTVRFADNPRYWQLLNQFERLTGVPCILNTSFNLRGEPIVCSPRDAVQAFLAMGLDYLVIGDLVAAREPASLRTIGEAVRQV